MFYEKELWQYLKNADDILSDANNILALEYINNAKHFLDEPEFICIKRNGSSHDSLTPENDFASAEYLRKKIYADLLYAQAANVLNNCKLLYWIHKTKLYGIAEGTFTTIINRKD